MLVFTHRCETQVLVSGTAMHTFNLSTLEAEAEQRRPGQPGLQNETLPEKQRRTKKRPT